MPSKIDEGLNVAFFVFHTLWIAFVCVGWAWKRTRRWHVAAASITALSWFGLGIVYGWGYCPFTDWHWQVRERLGHRDPPSYVQLLISETMGIELSPDVANALALVVLVLAGIVTALLNLRDWRRERRLAS